MQFLDAANLPETIADVDALEQLLCRPTRVLADEMEALDGDILVLGVGGKMGPTVAGLAKNAAPPKRVFGVARFTEEGLRDKLEALGVETIACDLMDEAALAQLPQAKNIVFMAGRKFGAGGDLPLTWAMNSHLPALVAQAFPNSRIVAFSTGCVYPFVSVDGQGADETVPPDPPGEYAQSCVGRERMFEYFSARLKTPGKLFRLNYAIDMRYGVLHDIAHRVLAREPVDVAMGHVNVIWQGDAAAQALRCLPRASTPTTPINVSGDRIVTTREIAAAIGKHLGIAPEIVGKEQPTAWITDTSEAVRMFGRPVVGLDRMIAWTADWVAERKGSLGKPTKFEVRDGRY
jgi:nucleoside-diphosphate-sugar epimerase